MIADLRSPNVAEQRSELRAVSWSVEGAPFDSRGRKAVDRPALDEIKARRADTFVVCSPVIRFELQISAAPSALRLIWVRRSTASRPWLFNDGPSDLAYQLLGLAFLPTHSLRPEPLPVFD